MLWHVHNSVRVRHVCICTLSNIYLFYSSVGMQHNTCSWLACRKYWSCIDNTAQGKIPSYIHCYKGHSNENIPSCCPTCRYLSNITPFPHGKGFTTLAKINAHYSLLGRLCSLRYGCCCWLWLLLLTVVAVIVLWTFVVLIICYIKRNLNYICVGVNCSS